MSPAHPPFLRPSLSLSFPLPGYRHGGAYVHYDLQYDGFPMCSIKVTNAIVALWHPEALGWRTVSHYLRQEAPEGLMHQKEASYFTVTSDNGNQ